MNIAIHEFSCSAGMYNSTYASSGRSDAVIHAEGYELLLFDSLAKLEIDGAPVTAPAGTLIRLVPGETCRLPHVCRMYYLRADAKDSSLAQYLDAWPRSVCLRDPKTFVARICDLAMAEETGEKTEFVSAAMCLCTQMQKEGRAFSDGAKLPTAKTEETVRRGVAYMDEHFREKCTLDEISAHVGRSSIYFHDIFEAVMGESPYEYIARLRLSEAKRLLAFSEVEPADIAAQCGYGSQSYFNYVFKKMTGLTPLAYRRSCAVRYLEGK